MNAALKVLVVDDDAANQMLICKQLSVLGCAAEAVGDAARALDAIARRKFDILLLDCQLPGMSGPELAAEVRRRELSGARPLVVGFCGSPSEEHRARCLRAGMDDYWSKPMSIMAMEERLAALARRGARHAVSRRDQHSAVAAAGSENERLEAAALAALDRVSAATGVNVRRRIIEAYLDDLAARRKAIARAVAAADLRTLADLAHPLISASAIVGAAEISALCARVEEHARASEKRPALRIARQLLERSQFVAIALRDAVGDR
jgi:CheY-like chemotaxis protein